MPTPQIVTTSAIQMQGTHPILPGSDPEISSLRDYLSEMNTHKAAVNALQEDSQRKDSELIQLNTELKEKSQMVDALKDEIESLNEKHARNPHSYAKFVDEIETIKLQRQEYQGHVKRLFATNDQLRTEIEHKTSVITEIEAELHDANEALIQWQLEKEAMTEDKEKHRQSLSTMSVAIGKLEAKFMIRSDRDDEDSRRAGLEYDLLMAANAQKDEKIQVLETTIKQYEVSISTRENDLQDLRARLTELLGQIKDTNNNLEKLQEDSDQVLNELEEYKIREEAGTRGMYLTQRTDPVTENPKVVRSEKEQESPARGGAIQDDEAE